MGQRYVSKAPKSTFCLISMMIPSFLPENTAVTVSPYVLQRSPQYFSPKPDSFWPDRWLRSSEECESAPDVKEPFIHNTAAFIPFSYGPANCVGKPLAMLEMRVVVALLIQRFDMRLADGYDPSRWEKELKDTFVFETGELPVFISARNSLIEIFSSVN